MATPEQLREAGKSTRFPHNDPTKGGRKPSILTTFKKAGYTKTDVRKTYSVIADMTIAEAQEIAADPNATVLETTIAEAFIKSAKKGDYRLVKDIIELFADKPNQAVDITSDNKPVQSISVSSIFEQLRKTGKVEE